MAYRLLCIWPVLTFSTSLISQITSSLIHIVLQSWPSTLYAVLLLLPQSLLPFAQAGPIIWGWVLLLYNHSTPWALAKPWTGPHYLPWQSKLLSRHPSSLAYPTSHQSSLHLYSFFSNGTWRKTSCCCYVSPYPTVWHVIGTQKLIAKWVNT